MVFCSSCGNEETSDKRFCSKCGSELIISDLPKETPRKKKFESFADKFSIIMGIFVLLTGIVGSNLTNALMGIVLFTIGFVGMKTNSKSVKQLITIISMIIVVVAFFNLTTLF